VPGLAKLHLSLLRHFQRVVNFDSDVTHRALEFSVPKQELNSPKVLGAALDQRRLGPTHRMRTVCRRIESDLLNPVVDNPRLLARAQVWRCVDPAGKEVAVRLQASLLDPGRDHIASRGRDLELDRALRFLLQHNCLRSHPITMAHVADAQALLNERLNQAEPRRRFCLNELIDHGLYILHALLQALQQVGLGAHIFFQNWKRRNILKGCIEQRRTSLHFPKSRVVQFVLG